MNCNLNRIQRANEAADRLNEAVNENRWNEVLKMVEDWPELLFWDKLEANYGGGMFLRIWEEDRWIGRQCVRILLKTPELLNKVSLANYGISTFQLNHEEYWVVGPLMGLLAGAGERELMKEALETGLDPDGWTDGGWYEGTDGLYYFGQPPICMLHKHNGGTYHLLGDCETTPLLVAIFREDVEMVRLLIKHGATFVPDSELCRERLKELSSWTIRDMLKKAYGG